MTTPPLTLETLRADITALLEDDSVTLGLDDNLMDAGLDSMRAMDLAMRWDEEGVPLDFADLSVAPTLGELWELAQSRLESAAS